ncbi:putative two-component sensor histidine kinase [Alicycliphilus sp. B1]|nr:putative two-component sensor histidine kinase [Alicycliphilus sp. B1]
MTDPRSLRSRITAAYVLLACAVCGAFAAVAVYLLGSIEDRLIDERLERTADRLEARLREGRDMDLPPSVTLYRGSEIPPALRNRQPGRSDMPKAGVSVNVLVRGTGEDTFVLTDNDADFESIKWDVYAALGAAFFACVALAVVLGRVTASRVIAPVTALAKAVQEDRLPTDYPALASRDEMGVLSRAFSNRATQLQQFLQRERWFVGDVSHELRTPLTVILGAAEVMRARARGQPELVDIAQRIRRTAADTAERVSAMLLLSREPELVDAPRTALVPLIRQEMERCQPLLHGKDVEMMLAAPAEVYVYARPELAGIAIGNLIRNACQFTEQGTVSIRLEPERLIVEDTGVGIPAAIKERVFERFVRASSETATGSGLGLAIVRRVAEHLGWHVTLEDVPGGGSRFCLMLKSPATDEQLAG